MKIMIIAPYFYPSVGGVQNYSLNIALGLKNFYNHEVCIVTSGKKEGSIQKQSLKGMVVYRLPHKFSISNTPMSFKWRSQIKEIIKAQNPDIIIAHTPVPFMSDIAIRKKIKIPFILTYHNDLTKSGTVGKLLAKLYYLIFLNKTLRKSDMIIATSEHYAKNSPYISKYYKKTKIISPGADLNRFNEEVDGLWLKKKYPGKKIVLFVGNMDQANSHKGMDILLDSIAKAKKSLPNIQLVAVGKGNAIQSHKQHCKDLSIEKNVEFTSYVQDKDLPKYYAGADVFVLPSVTEAEGFGMVLIEAMACGTPVIGSDVGGIPYVIQDSKNGFLVKPGDSDNLSNKILKILTDNKLADSFRKNNSKYIMDNFSSLNSVEKTENLLLSIIKGSSRQS